MSNYSDILDILTRLEQQLPELIRQAKLNPSQIQLTALSDISKNLGLIQAGEFRSPGEPGHGFSGVRVLPSGILVYNNDLITGEISQDGDWSIGSNISSPTTTGWKIFSHAQTYNGESFGAGDILIGDNSSGGVNMKWDAAAGSLQFRLGTTTLNFMSGTGNMTGIGCKVYRTTNFTVHSGALTAIPWDNEAWDDAGFHSNVTNNTRFTIPAGCGGIYQVGFFFQWNAVGAQTAGYISVNGSTTEWPFIDFEVANQDENSGVYDVLLAAGDYIEIQCAQASAGDKLIQTVYNASSPSAWIRRVR